MDPASHVLFGTMLTAGVARTPRRRLLAIAAIGSVLPDIDAVAMPVGWDRYLKVHEIGTHSIAGTVVLAALLAWIATWIAARRRRRRLSARPLLSDARGSGGRRPSNAAHHRDSSVETVVFGNAFWAAWAGTGSHLFWDVANGGDVRLFWPIARMRAGGHLVAMADPIVLAILVIGAACALTMRSRLAGIASVTLLALAGLLCGKLVLQSRALAHYQAAAARDGAPVFARAIESRWGGVDDWLVYDRTPSMLRVWRAQGVKADAALLFTRELPSESPELEASKGTSTVAHALNLFDFAFAETRAAGGGTEVLWSDIRFCTPSDCVLWFGARLDREGRVVRQIVKVGGLVQER